jgi:hypothetical protein
MQTSKVKKLIVGLSLGIMLVVGLGATTAEAQRRRGHRPPRVVYRVYDPFWYRRYDPFWDSYYYPRYQVVDPIAYQREKGFKEGKDEGEEDAKKGRGFNARGHKDYLKSDSTHFREAFVQGYEAGYREEIADLREKGRD